jgi:hypothetical protein
VCCVCLSVVWYVYLRVLHLSVVPMPSTENSFAFQLNNNNDGSMDVANSKRVLTQKKIKLWTGIAQCPLTRFWFRFCRPWCSVLRIHNHMRRWKAVPSLITRSPEGVGLTPLASYLRRNAPSNLYIGDWVGPRSQSRSAGCGREHLLPLPEAELRTSGPAARRLVAVTTKYPPDSK